MKTTLKLALIAFTSITSVSLSAAQEKATTMKSTKDCGNCCTQGGDCCAKCGTDKCGSCCDKKDEPKKEEPKK